MWPAKGKGINKTWICYLAECLIKSNIIVHSKIFNKYQNWSIVIKQHFPQPFKTVTNEEMDFFRLQTSQFNKEKYSMWIGDFSGWICLPQFNICIEIFESQDLLQKLHNQTQDSKSYTMSVSKAQLTLFRLEHGGFWYYVTTVNDSTLASHLLRFFCEARPRGKLDDDDDPLYHNILWSTSEEQ